MIENNMNKINNSFNFLSVNLLIWIACLLVMVPIVRSQEKENKQSDEEQSNIIKFDVGGKKFKVARSTIENSDSFFLKNMINPQFNNKKDKRGYLFIDKDPNYFNYLVHFLRESTLSDKALRNIHDAHRAAIYFQSDAMITATMNTENFSCKCDFCEAVVVSTKREAEKIKLEKIKAAREKLEKILKDHKITVSEKFAEIFQLSFETDLEVKVNGQNSTKHYYWSKDLPEKHPWPDTEEKRNSLCPPPSRLPSKAEYDALGKKMKSAGAYNPDYFVTNKTDPDHHQSFRNSFPWSSESYGDNGAWVFGGNYGVVFNDSRSNSEAIRCVVVVD